MYPHLVLHYEPAIHEFTKSLSKLLASFTSTTLCSMTIRKRILEKHYSFLTSGAGPLASRLSKRRKSRGSVQKMKTCSRPRQKIRCKRETLQSDSPAPSPSLIKSAWTAKADHWTNDRCKAQHSCTRRKRPSTAIVAIAATDEFTSLRSGEEVHIFHFPLKKT